MSATLWHHDDPMKQGETRAPPPRIQEAFDQTLTRLLRRGRQKSTVSLYAARLAQFGALLSEHGCTTPEEIRPEHVAAFKRWLETYGAPGWHDKAMVPVSGFLRDLVVNGVVDADLFGELVTPRPSDRLRLVDTRARLRRSRTGTVAELRRLAQWFDHTPRAKTPEPLRRARRQVVRELQRLAFEGRLPTQRTLRLWGYTSLISKARAVFGSWQNAARTAELSQAGEGPSAEESLAALEKWAIRLGRPPLANELPPSLAVSLRRHFGGMAAARRCLGLSGPSKAKNGARKDRCT